MKFQKVLQQINEEEIKNSKIIGTMFLEFAKQKNKILLKADVEGLLTQYFDLSSHKIYLSIEEFIDDLKFKLGRNFGDHGYNLNKKVRENIFDPKYFDDIEESLNQICRSEELRSKLQSLTTSSKEASIKEQNPNWDMKIMFKREKDSNRIAPDYSYGSQYIGKIIGKDEIEKKDKELKKYIKK